LLSGSVALARVYDRALSADEVAWLYAEPHAPIWTPNPVWYFDTGALAVRQPWYNPGLGPRFNVGF